MRTFSEELPAIGVSPGRIIGTVLQMPSPNISEPPAGEQLLAGVTAEQATAALKAAAKAVHDELKARADTVSGDGKAVLEATALMATDTMLLEIRHQLYGCGKSLAAGHLGSRRLRLGNAAQPGRLHGRARDRRPRCPGPDRGGTAWRLRAGISVSATPFILIAEDLASADIVILVSGRILALPQPVAVRSPRSPSSPARWACPRWLLAVGVDELDDGTEVYVDGAAGLITADPDAVPRPRRGPLGRHGVAAVRL